MIIAHIPVTDMLNAGGEAAVQTIGFAIISRPSDRVKIAKEERMLVISAADVNRTLELLTDL